MKSVVANNELLQSRLDAGLAALVEEANRGEPIWWKQSAWIWGLPTWSRSGRPFRGLAALLLWRAAADSRVPVAWQEAENQEDPTAVVIPMRGKRGFRPLAVVPAQRFGALPFAVPKWDEPQIEKALAALKFYDCPTLVPIASHIQELTGAFVQSLRRHAAPMSLRHSDWTILSLPVAAWISATAADAAYAAQVGKVFSDEQIWERGDVAALFPWEAQEPGGPLPWRQHKPEEWPKSADRKLKRDGGRILANGKKPGQIPRREGSALLLDRIWERGGVLEGYSRVLKVMAALDLFISGDAVLDSRTLGLQLSKKMARLEKLPRNTMTPVNLKAWRYLKKHVLKKSWAHRLHVLKFKDLFVDSRWQSDRIIPRVRKVLSKLPNNQPPRLLTTVSLKDVGLVRLLDAMGPKRPTRQPQTTEILQQLDNLSDHSYQRRPIHKSDGTERWLDIPNPELAKAQEKLVKLLRPSAPFAGVATAFEPGRSPAFQAIVHEGAVAAVVVDIADFFGSIRPRHIRWAFHPRKSMAEILPSLVPAKQKRLEDRLLVSGGTRVEREKLIAILFAHDSKGTWLPQGAPSSPWAANLAAHPMDRRIRAWTRDYPDGVVRYSRYADDLVLSLHENPNGAPSPDDTSIKRFLNDAEQALRNAVQARGWVLKEEKTRRWRRDSRVPLTLCGIEVPEKAGEPCRLPRLEHRRAKAALHKLRCGAQQPNPGFLAWAWAATGQPGWLAWTNQGLSTFAVTLAGRILAETLVNGWADGVDAEND